MTEAEINKLKAICEKEGLHLEFESITESGLIFRKKKKQVDYIGWEHGKKGNQVHFIFDFNKLPANIPEIGAEFDVYLKNHLSHLVDYTDYTGYNIENHPLKA